MLMLMRQTTGEAWNYVMYYCMQADKYRACDKAYGSYAGEACGGPIAGVLFHVLWQLLGTYVLMQLFTGVIIENFVEVTKGSTSMLDRELMNQFVDAWCTLDKHCFGCIRHEQLIDLIQMVEPPVGLKGKLVSNSMLMNVLKDLHIPIRNGKIHYYETFEACIKRVVALPNEEDEDPEEREQAAERAAFEAYAEEQKAMAGSLGLKWVKIGDVKPSVGRELDNQALAEALAESTKFSQQDWSKFEVVGLRMDDFIKSGDCYFKPVSRQTMVHKDDDFLDDSAGKRRATAGEVFACIRLQQAHREWKENRVQVIKGIRMMEQDSSAMQIPLDGNPDEIVSR
jgi:hypothetical protein